MICASERKEEGSLVLYRQEKRINHRLIGMQDGGPAYQSARAAQETKGRGREGRIHNPCVCSVLHATHQVKNAIAIDRPGLLLSTGISTRRRGSGRKRAAGKRWIAGGAGPSWGLNHQIARAWVRGSSPPSAVFSMDLIFSRPTILSHYFLSSRFCQNFPDCPEFF